MRTVIPFDATDPKTRLSPVLDADERATVASLLLQDVIDAVQGAGLEPTVIATEPVDLEVPVRVDPRPLTPLIGEEIERATPLAVVMADLALLERPQVSRLVETDGDVVIAPGLGGGTNALVVRDPTFDVDYHGTSFVDHLAIARERDLTTAVVDSFRLAVDVDEPADLLEVLVHGTGRTVEWLEEAGFEIQTDGGRPRVTRDVES
ncbi:MAG: 2-phospho-L-lactate guanylyltransferase [Halodesulfurarchaeum sp.]